MENLRTSLSWFGKRRRSCHLITELTHLYSNALMNDLQHPNEYIRGSTLRFLCKIKEAELLEPLVPSVRACLEHRHSYVRKNAVFAIGSIYKSFDVLFPDAPEVIESFLLSVGSITLLCFL